MVSPNPFVGLMLLVAFPFFFAMLILLRAKREIDSFSFQLGLLVALITALVLIAVTQIADPVIVVLVIICCISALVLIVATRLNHIVDGFSVQFGALAAVVMSMLFIGLFHLLGFIFLS